MTTDYRGFSDEDLAKAEADLAAERTRIRHEQNAAAAEREFRAAMAAMTPSARRIVQIRLEGETSPTGESAASDSDTAEEG